jgi:opacity protein-like surface antigen
MISLRRVIVAAVCASGLQVPSLLAQGAIDERGRFELAAGPVWTGRASFGSAAATETSASGGRFLLFSTASELAPAGGIEGRIGVSLTPALQVEASSSYAHVELRTTVSGDSDNGPSAVLSETTQQVTIDGGVMLRLVRWRFGGRAVPFVAAGAGYLRQVHEGNTLAVTGQTYRAGGGVNYLLMSRTGLLKGIGIRGDLRATVRRKGVAFDNRAHTSPAAAATVFFRF